MNDKTRKSRILADVHETAVGLHRAGLIDKRRMGEFIAQRAFAQAAEPDRAQGTGSGAVTTQKTVNNAIASKA